MYTHMHTYIYIYIYIGAPSVAVSRSMWLRGVDGDLERGH